MKQLSKGIAFILSVAFILTMVSACGSEKQIENPFESDFVYLPKYTKAELSDENTIGRASAQLGDKIIVSVFDNQESNGPNGENTKIMSISYIYSFDMNNPKLEKLPGYEPLVISELAYGDFNIVHSEITNMTTDKSGNIYVVENYHASSANEDEESKRGSFIRKLDVTGKELLRAEAESILGTEGFYLHNIIISPEVKLCFVSNMDNKLVFVDENLNKIGEKTLGDIRGLLGSAQGAEGKTYLMYLGNEGKAMVSELDFEARGTKAGVSIDRNAYSMYKGGGGFDFLVGDNANLYGCNAETGKTEYILGFTNSGIDMNNIRFINILENGDILALTDNSMSTFFGGAEIRENQSYEIVYLTKTPKDEAPEVQTITLAGIGIDSYLNWKIFEFNKKSADVKIEVKDYSVFNSNVDYTAGETKLLAEIGAGNVPDIICSQANMRGLHQSFVKKGMLIDLLPLLDADKELGGREALFAPVLNASLKDGKLYTLSGGFKHRCCVAPSDLLPDEIATFEAAKAANEKLRENTSYFNHYVDGPAFLNLVMTSNQDDFIDFKNGKTMFDSQKFIDFLNFAKEMPTQQEKAMLYMEYEDPVIRVRDGKQLFMLLVNDAMLSEYRGISSLLNGKINFCSLPGSEKLFSVFDLERGLSISANCAHPELAWKFVRELVSEVKTYEQGNPGGFFPMNAKSFENLMNMLMEKHMVNDENGNEVEESNFSMETSDGEAIKLYALTKEQRNALMKLFKETTTLNEPDIKLMEIINEETATFLDGAKTAEETAKIIQNRASIYVSELSGE